jgi:hypothetical protein
MAVESYPLGTRVRRKLAVPTEWPSWLTVKAPASAAASPAWELAEGFADVVEWLGAVEGVCGELAVGSELAAGAATTPGCGLLTPVMDFDWAEAGEANATIKATSPVRESETRVRR